MIAEFGGRVPESEAWSVGAPLQWRNQLWQSLGAGTEERLGVWERPFSGVTNDGRIWRKGAGKGGLGAGTEERLGVWEHPSVV